MSLSRGSTWAGFLGIAVGLVVLLGWALNVDLLKAMIPGVLTMKANTAVCFVLLGAALTLDSGPARGSTSHRIAMVLAGTTIIVAAVTGSQYITGVNLGIDELLFAEPLGAIATAIPGRMAPATVIAFGSLALGVMAASRSPRLVIALSSVTLSLSYLNLLDFVFGAEVPAFLAGSTQMAANTAVAMGILAVGVLGRLGPGNPFLSLSGGSSASVLLRRLLIVSIALPFTFAWFRLEGQRLGLYDTSFGTSLMVVGITGLGAVAILHSASWAGRMEAAREAIEFERDRFFELSLDMLAVFDSGGRFRRANAAWRTTLGYSEVELIGRPLFELIHPDDLESTLAAAQLHFGDGERVMGFQNRYRHRDGTYRWLEWMSRMTPDGSLAFSVARDITDRKLLEGRRAERQLGLETRNERLSDRAVRDPLTGLHNRRHFEAAVTRLERRWRRAPVEERRPVAVIMFDLDYFGQLNKLHGHQAGDAVLRVFAGLLKKSFRNSDLVARYGGEEFVAILEGASSADAIGLAERVRKAFERVSVDVGNGDAVRATVSAGCAQLGDNRSVSEGLSVADVWLNQAKRAGRNQVVGL